jgi:DNA-binding MarR family transcriptional regulator
MADEELADALRLVTARLARRLRQPALGDLTPSQRSVLASLGRHGPLRMGELARIENITPPSLTGIVTRLVDRGLVTRTEDPGDGRSTLVAATAAGAANLEAARREKTAFLTTRIRHLGDEERRLLRAAVLLLDRIVAGE